MKSMKPRISGAGERFAPLHEHDYEKGESPRFERSMLVLANELEVASDCSPWYLLSVKYGIMHKVS